LIRHSCDDFDIKPLGFFKEFFGEYRAVGDLEELFCR
jgi:hypothetical protein